jgi:nucleotide-binding universal stress UspA family protein
MSTPQMEAPRQGSAPVRQPVFPPMRVLLATDGSDCAETARRCLSLLPLPAGSAIHAVTVLDAQTWQVPESLKGAEQEWARRILEETETALRREGVELTHAAPRGAPAYEIIRAAEEFDADLLVVGSHGRTGFERFLLGSVAANVAKHAGCSVLVCCKPGLHRVLLTVDSSEHAEEAVRFTGVLPLPPGTELTVCHVVRPYYLYPAMGSEYVPQLEQIVADIQQEQRSAAARLVDSARTALEGWGRHASTAVREGDPATEIVHLATQQEADLVIAGARGVSPIRGLLVGSVADRLLKSARCSVLLVR